MSNASPMECVQLGNELELAYGSKQKYGANLHGRITGERVWRKAGNKGMSSIGANNLKKSVQAKGFQLRSNRLAKQLKLTRIKTATGRVGKVGAALATAGAVGYGINKLRKR